MNKRTIFRSFAAFIGTLAIAVAMVAPASSASAATMPALLAQKPHWTAVVAHLTDTPPVRWQMMNYRFYTDTNGSLLVDGWAQTWIQKLDTPPSRLTVATVNNCNPSPVAGESYNCPVYGSAPDVAGTSYTGTFSYTGSGTSGQVTINWSAGSGGGTQKFDLSLVDSGKLGKMTLVPPAAGWEGVGYGSSKSWTSANLTASKLAALGGPYEWVGRFKTWEAGAIRQGQINMPVRDLVVPSAGSSNVAWIPSSSGRCSNYRAGQEGNECPPPPPSSPSNDTGTRACLAGTTDNINNNVRTQVLGENHMVYVQPNSRLITYEHHKRCLTRDGIAPYADSANTIRGAHILMLTAIVNDDGVLVGALGGEASSSGMTGGGFVGWGSYGLIDFVNR